MAKETANPWSLTPAEAAAFDAVIEHGCHKLAAKALCIAVKTVECHCHKGGVKIGGDHKISRYIKWDRWRRSCGAGFVGPNV